MEARTIPGFTFVRATQLVGELEALLVKHDVVISINSLLEEMVLDVFGLEYRELQPKPDEKWPNVRRRARASVGLEELARVILRASEHPDFGKLAKHFELFTKSMKSGVIQNVPSPKSDEGTNKLFELLIGAAAMHCGGSLDMDEPKKSSGGKNPDILLTIDQRRWGFACKAIHSLHHEAFIANLAKGIDQIGRSSATTGAVVINMKNVLDHDRYWPITNPVEANAGEEPLFGAFSRHTIPEGLLKQDLSAFVERISANVPAGFLEQLFAGKKAVPGVVLWAHATTAVRIGGAPVPTSLPVMMWHTIGAVAEADTHVIDCIREALVAHE